MLDHTYVADIIYVLNIIKRAQFTIKHSLIRIPGEIMVSEILYTRFLVSAYHFPMANSSGCFGSTCPPKFLKYSFRISLVEDFPFSYESRDYESIKICILNSKFSNIMSKNNIFNSVQLHAKS